MALDLTHSRLALLLEQPLPEWGPRAMRLEIVTLGTNGRRPIHLGERLIRDPVREPVPRHLRWLPGSETLSIECGDVLWVLPSTGALPV